MALGRKTAEPPRTPIRQSKPTALVGFLLCWINNLFGIMVLMAEMSRRFNFDDFDEQIREALAENAEQMGKLATRGLVAVPDSLMPPEPPEPPDQAA